MCSNIHYFKYIYLNFGQNKRKENLGINQDIDIKKYIYIYIDKINDMQSKRN